MGNSHSAEKTTAGVLTLSALFLIGGYYLRNQRQSAAFIDEVGESNVRLIREEGQGAEEENDEDRGNGMGNERDLGAAFDNDDRARRALEERQQQLIQQMQAGEAGEQRLNAWKQKGIVGTKKAKSLARREQRRAYFEYVRSVADQERERIKLEEDMFGDLLAEEREEREKRIAQAKLALDKENAKRRQEEEKDRQQRAARRDALLADLDPAKGGIAKLSSDEDVEIAEDLSDVIVLESGDYAIRVTPSSVNRLAEQLREKGRLDLKDISAILAKAY